MGSKLCPEPNPFRKSLIFSESTRKVVIMIYQWQLTKNMYGKGDVTGFSGFESIYEDLNFYAVFKLFLASDILQLRQFYLLRRTYIMQWLFLSLKWITVIPRNSVVKYCRSRHSVTFRKNSRSTNVRNSYSLKCWKNKNLYDMKIYFQSRKIALYLIKYIFIMSPSFRDVKNIWDLSQSKFLCNQDKLVFNKIYFHYIAFFDNIKMCFYSIKNIFIIHIS